MLLVTVVSQLAAIKNGRQAEIISVLAPITCIVHEAYIARQYIIGSLNIIKNK